METVYKIYHELHVQSCLVCAATYSSASTEPVRRDVLYRALQQLIAEQYGLRVIAVARPSEKKPKEHIVWEAQLRKIDLDRIVEFVDADDTDNLHSVIEGAHNEWLDSEDHEVPLWRLKVVNGRHLVWVYSHFVGDGMSGYAFHRGLLRLLNEQPQTTGRTASVCEPPPVDPPQIWFKDWPKPFSFLRLIWDVLSMTVLKFFFAAYIMFADVPYDSKQLPWSARHDGTVKCKTKLYTLRIPSELQKEILGACRKHKVTFSTLLHTVTMMAAATDLYPKAKIGLASLAVSARNYAVPKQSSELILNSVTTNMGPRLLGKYREAAAPPKDPLLSEASGAVYIDPEKTWKITREYLEHLRLGLDTYSLANGLLSMKWVGNEMETIFRRTFPNLSLYQRFFMCVSNIGAFDAHTPGAPQSSTTPVWTIQDIQLSAAAIRSNYGWACPNHNVAGVRGGDCVINTVMEEGLIPDASIEKLHHGMLERLRLLVKLDKLA